MANLEDLIDPEYGLQQDEWSLTRPRFGAEGQLEVIGWSGKYAGTKLYISRCAVCSKDREVWAGGYFSRIKAKYLIGNMPCGCSKIPKYSENQWAVLGNRASEVMGYTFLGITSASHHKRVEVKCPKCAEDSELFGEGVFSVLYHELLKGSRPCGCSKLKKWTGEEQLIRCRRKAEKLGYKFLGFVEGYKNAHSKIRLSCKIHGEWSACSVNNLIKERGCPECGKLKSADGRRTPLEERLKIVEDVCKGTTLKFVKTVGEYNDVFDLVVMNCSVHGDYEVPLKSVCDGHGCFQCGVEKRAKGKTIPEDVMIQKFMASGQFEEGTKFVKVGSRNKKAVWEVFCPACETSGISTLDNLQQGKRPCSCGTARQKEAYINFVKESAVPIAVKFGIANKSEIRIRNQNSRCIYEVENFGVWEFETKKSCLSAERECKQTLECGILTREEMPDGFTETTWAFNLEKIIAIYEKHGGKRIK